MSALVSSAEYFARGVHAGQKYGKEPYITHLGDVVHRLTDYIRCPPELLAAAYLHDTLEDHGDRVTPQLLREMFGSRVVDLVSAVTLPPACRNRGERLQCLYRKIVACGQEAIALKLADRIANVANCVLSGHRKLGMYQQEWPGFQHALRGRTWKVGWAVQPADLDRMWEDLTILLEG